MKPTIVKVSYIRVLIFALVIAFPLLSLLPVTSGQRQRFYVEIAPRKAGTSARSTPLIKVTAVKDRQVYDTVEVPTGEAGNLEFKLMIRGQCPEKMRAGDATLTIDSGKKDTYDYLGFPIENRSIGPDHGQGWEYRSVSLPFLLPKSPFSLTEMCNQEVRRREGKARVKMLNDGLNFDISDAYKGRLSVHCHYTKNYEYLKTYIPFEAYIADMPVTVRCMPTYYGATKGPPPRTGRHYDPSIATVAVTADPPASAGRQCPLYVNFRGKITAGEKSRYATFNTKYHFLGDHDYRSEWIPLSVKRGETRTVNGRRFIQATNEDPPGLKMPGSNQKLPIFNGWMLLEVLLPDDTVRSDKVPFTVDCNSQPMPVKMKSQP